MNIPPILMLLLLGHVLGDFYFQWDSMAQNKNNQQKWLLVHGGIYMLCMAAILFIGAALSWYWLLVVLVAGIVHLAVDWLKKHISNKKFIIDQLLHITTFVVLWRILGEYLNVHEFVLRDFERLQTNIFLVVLGLLWILKPVGVLIEQGDIWDFNKRKDTATPENNHTTPTDNQKGAGKMIGYLERVIVFFLLLNGQFAAIGFVLAAKSAIRFPEITKSENTSSLVEFYIIGTLLSMTSVFAIAFLLGLI